ncbi:MAG: XRE family transcriptional regulator [Eubacterium sp.]|nr:XRE family transcriptional regulator [Eubacterium sp.]
MYEINLRLAASRKAAHLSQQEVAEKLTSMGLATKNKSISAWEKGLATPNAVQLLALCQIYGIKDIYGTFIDENSDELTSGLNETGKEKVREYAELLKESKKYSLRIKTKNVIEFHRTLPLYELPVSAGTGEFLDNSYYEMIEVPPNVPRNADFALRISGDSMTPKFMDGQIIWVKKTTQLNNGDIGIFYLDGQAYCKKIDMNGGRLRLISLNKKYKPIDVNDNSDFRIYGQVL